MNVLVTDAQTRIALYAIRSLGRKGVHVSALIEKRFDNKISFGTKSKYMKEKIVINSDLGNDQHYIQELSRIAQDFDVIFPIMTETIMAVTKNRSLFKGIKHFLPTYENITQVQNKSWLYKYAQELDIPTPKTFIPESVAQVKDIAKSLRFPVYIKLKEEKEFRPQQRYCVANDRDQFFDLYHRMHERLALPVIQEKVQGTVMGFFSLFDEHSEPLAIFGHRRIRQYPYRGGPSCFCESFKNSQVQENGLKLLTSLKWQGLAMVEFIQDELEGIPKLLEVNPRLWGSIPLATQAGIDFPYLMYQKALGQRVGKKIDYPEGQKIRFLIADIKAFVDAMKYTENKMQYTRQFIKDLLDFRIRDGIIQWDDFKPTLAYLGMIIGQRTKTI